MNKKGSLSKTGVLLVVLVAVIFLTSLLLILAVPSNAEANINLEDINTYINDSINGSPICTPANGFCSNTTSSGSGGWNATVTTTTTTLIANINGMYLCHNGTHGIITVNETYATTNC